MPDPVSCATISECREFRQILLPRVVPGVVPDHWVEAYVTNIPDRGKAPEKR